MATLTQIQQEIEATKKKLEQLEKEAKVYKLLTPSHRFASELHKILCRYNHIDGCLFDDDYHLQGYYSQHSVNVRYLNFANELLHINPVSEYWLDIARIFKRWM